jgi:hypothetical protein
VDGVKILEEDIRNKQLRWSGGWRPNLITLIRLISLISVITSLHSNTITRFEPLHAEHTSILRAQEHSTVRLCRCISPAATSSTMQRGSKRIRPLSPTCVEKLVLVEKKSLASIGLGSDCTRESHDVLNENDHCCFEHDVHNDHVQNSCRDCCFTTIGRGNIKIHVHPLGLAQIIFDNCVVKVRLGHDLDLLVCLSSFGPVQLHNIRSIGWIPTNRTLLPSFLFLRWLSSMDGK